MAWICHFFSTNHIPPLAVLMGWPAEEPNSPALLLHNQITHSDR